MEFTLTVIFSIVLSIIFFSSGITIVSTTHLELLREFGKQNRFYRWISNGLLSVIAVTVKIRTAWIRMISPDPGPDSK